MDTPGHGEFGNDGPATEAGDVLVAAVDDLILSRAALHDSLSRFTRRPTQLNLTVSETIAARHSDSYLTLLSMVAEDDAVSPKDYFELCLTSLNEDSIGRMGHVMSISKLGPSGTMIFYREPYAAEHLQRLVKGWYAGNDPQLLKGTICEVFAAEFRQSITRDIVLLKEGNPYRKNREDDRMGLYEKRYRRAKKTAVIGAAIATLGISISRYLSRAR